MHYRYPWAEPYYYSQNPFYPDPYNYQGWQVGAASSSAPGVASMLPGGAGIASAASIPLGMVVPPLGAYNLGKSIASRLPPLGPGGAGERISQPRSMSPADSGLGSGMDLSTIAKVGIVAGGVLAAFLIYRMSSSAGPIAERMGRAGGKLLAIRYGGKIKGSSAGKLLTA